VQQGWGPHDALELLVGVRALVKLPDLAARGVLENGPPGVVQHGRVAGLVIRRQLRHERVAGLRERAPRASVCLRSISGVCIETAALSSINQAHAVAQGSPYAAELTCLWRQHVCPKRFVPDM